MRDHYAAAAMHMERDIGRSHADPQVHQACERFAWSIIPSASDGIFDVLGADDKVVETIRRGLLAPHGRDVWRQPTASMEFHQYVTMMMWHRDVFAHFDFVKRDERTPWELAYVLPLPQETIVCRRDPRGVVYEQYFSRQGSIASRGYVVDIEPREYFFEFDASEILHLSWPLDEPSAGISPVESAYRLEAALQREWNHSLMNAKAAAEPGETFWSIARSRAGAYADSVERQRTLNSAIGDRLFLPIEEDVPEWFAVDRLVRSRIAICRVREYVLGAFTEQVIRPWCERNGWAQARLALGRTFFTIDDWIQLHQDYRRGSATFEDFLAAMDAESSIERSTA